MKITFNDKLLSLQDIAKHLNISYQTLNYYTSIGLLYPKKRKGNKRLYEAKETKKRLKTVYQLKNEGYPLKIISNIINGNQKNGNLTINIS